MGMRIGSSNATNASQAPGIGSLQQRQQGIKSLFTALQSGDLAAAQTSFANLSGTGGSISASSGLGQIGQALQSGDLAGAQKVAQSMRSGRTGHHHHTSSMIPSPTTAPPATPGSGSLLDVVA